MSIWTQMLMFDCKGTGVKTAVSVDKQKQEAVCMDTDDIASVETGVKIIMCIDRDKKEPIHMKTDADVTCMETGVKKTACIDRDKKKHILVGKNKQLLQKRGENKYLLPDGREYIIPSTAHSKIIQMEAECIEAK